VHSGYYLQGGVRRLPFLTQEKSGGSGLLPPRSIRGGGKRKRVRRQIGICRPERGGQRTILDGLCEEGESTTKRMIIQREKRKRKKKRGGAGSSPTPLTSIAHAGRKKKGGKGEASHANASLRFGEPEKKRKGGGGGTAALRTPRKKGKETDPQLFYLPAEAKQKKRKEGRFSVPHGFTGCKEEGGGKRASDAFLLWGLIREKKGG